MQAEKKHKSYQELDRFMHYYTRFKNHEHSYQVMDYFSIISFPYFSKISIQS